MVTDLLQLAATDISSAANEIGEIIVAVVSGILVIGLPIVFILCLVKLISTKNKAWLIGLVLSGLSVIALICVAMVGAYMGYKNIVSNARSAANSGVESIVKIPDSKLSLNIPSHWNNIEGLNEAASFSVGNHFGEEYLIVIAEPKADFDGDLTAYADLSASSMIDSIETPTTKDPLTVSINGLPAIQREFSGSIDRTKIAYLHTSIEGSEHYYQIVGWTLPSRKATAFKVIYDVINSAKEL